MTNIELAELLLQYPEMDVKFPTEFGMELRFDLTPEMIKQVDDYILIDVI